MATKPAKSSMSIFSSWLAAPYSGVITYRLVSTWRHDRRVALADAGGARPGSGPKPAALQAASAFGQRLADLEPASRRGERAHVDARAPAPGVDRVHADAVASSAPPLLRRDGSIEITAIDSASSWSRRKRAPASSVSELLPAPPVPGNARSTGTFASGQPALRRASRSFGSAWPSSSAVIACASAASVSPTSFSRQRLDRLRRQRRQVGVAGGDHRADHSRQPHLLPVLGEKMRATP